MFSPPEMIMSLARFQPGNACAHLPGYFGELRVDDHGRGAAVVRDVADLVGHEAEVDRHADRAEPGRREVRLNHLEAVVRERRDAIALRRAALGQRIRQPGDPVVQLAERQFPVLEAEGPLVGRLARGAGELLAV